MDKRKQDKIKKIPTSSLDRILSTLAGPEAEEASAEFPLGGKVSLDGIGFVEVSELRAERARREQEQEPVWASEEEKQAHFHAETFPPSERKGGTPDLTQLRARALEVSEFTPREIRSMTRAEIIRLLDGHDPRD